MISFEILNNELIEKNFKFETPYGERLLTYADFTASGKSLKFIEKYLLEIQKFYANTHTEDDMTGEVMTKILHKAASIIKKLVNAEKNCYIIPSGTGATGAIECLAKILGIYIPPAAKNRLGIVDFDKESNDKTSQFPVIFIGPYEHHSNILIWEEGLAELVEIGLREDGTMDLDDLKSKISDRKYKNRLKIGSFSAASNVTGILTPVYEVAEILHNNNALACFDFAACAPYIEINMNKSDSEYFDAIYLAPHKFLGGPGSSGILVINKKLYDKSLPPTVSGGGTVNYVSTLGYDYIENVELREMAGTPGIMQIIKAALVIELKNSIGIDNIISREKSYVQKVFERLIKNQNIEILGPSIEHERLPIFSIKIKYNDKYLHPRFVAILINDLFGIQTRAGCSCAAPYGHRLLEINDETSEIFRHFIKDGLSSVKPGWLRFNLHYIMNEAEVEYIIRVIEFIAEFGYLFLYDYVVDLKSGKWVHKNKNKSIKCVEDFGIEESLKYIEDKNTDSKLESISYNEEYKNYLSDARKYAEQIKKKNDFILKTLNNEKFKGQGWFYFVNSENEK
ncbi:MAG: aminotransferase class V-fold PLP-dependent enzyme [Sedimentibacter sp.]|jgi:selenocysteine lyase/cysteine desulfurase|nr:aminotransferase class V-fold PLP-dependent enzyme [Sedimentibacter sp.]